MVLTGRSHGSLLTARLRSAPIGRHPYEIDPRELFSPSSICKTRPEDIKFTRIAITKSSTVTEREKFID